MSSTPDASHDINTYAAFLISTFVNSALLGILTIQTGHYYRTFKDDPRITKIWVAVVVLVHYAHSLAAAMMTYSTLITHFPFAAIKQRMLWMPVGLGTLEAVSTALTQLWFARRQYLLLNSANRWFAIVVVFVSLSTLTAGLVVAGNISHNFFLLTPHDYWFEYIWLGGNLLGDIMVTVPVALRLYHTRSAYAATNKLMAQIMVWVVASGALTATVALIVLVLYVSKTQSMVFVPIARLLSSLYANSLLAFLNRRTHWGKDADDSDGLQHFSESNYNRRPMLPLSMGNFARRAKEKISPTSGSTEQTWQEKELPPLPEWPSTPYSGSARSSPTGFLTRRTIGESSSVIEVH